MHTIRIPTVVALAVLTCAVAATLAVAHSSIERGATNDLAALTEQANLVFIGRVAKVDYRMSEPGSESKASIPYTIVTYEVGNVLRGEAPGKTFTMRFIGGPDGRGRFLDVSGVPKFQPGERDLLFVTGNGEKNCPLVLCEWGRFRILQGGVYNTEGVPVRAMIGKRVAARGMPRREFRTFRYPAPKFDDLIENPEAREILEKSGISMKEARKRYESEAPKEIEVLTEVSPQRGGKDAAKSMDRPSPQGAQEGEHAIAMTPEGIPEGPMAIEQFVSSVQKLVREARRKPEPVKSIDPDAPIRVTAAQLRAPANPPKARADDRPATPEEAAELEALQKQSLNPVLKKK